LIVIRTRFVRPSLPLRQKESIMPMLGQVEYTNRDGVSPKMRKGDSA
jgi:hypothetical protein